MSRTAVESNRVNAKHLRSRTFRNATSHQSERPRNPRQSPHKAIPPRVQIYPTPQKQKNLTFARFQMIGGQGRDRTGDTRIFSPLLYQLSYLATCASVKVGDGRGAGIRTLDPVIKSHLLYQLSYAPISPWFHWSEERDSNPRQPPWQGGTLPTELSSHRENGV